MCLPPDRADSSGGKPVKFNLPNRLKSSGKDVAACLGANGLFYSLGALTVLGVKYHYSTADADDLGWMLAPVARLVELAGGIHFERELRTGFVSISHGIIIAPACAGLNFLIICFSTIFFTLVSRLRGPAAKWTWFGVSITAAWLVTLWTNTIRILLSIYLYGAPIYGGWVTPERVHRLAGTLTYVSVLVVTYLAAERMTRGFSLSGPLAPITAPRKPGQVPSATRMLPVPFAWYALITIFVPILNGTLRRNGSRFAEHALFITAASLSVFLAWLFIAALLKKKVDLFDETKEKKRKGPAGSREMPEQIQGGEATHHESTDTDRR